MVGLEMFTVGRFGLGHYYNVVWVKKFWPTAHAAYLRKKQNVRAVNLFAGDVIHMNVTVISSSLQ